jgi:hypothetical protein
MSKSTSTIAAKPKIDPALQWIGGTASSNDTDNTVVNTEADKLASQQVDKTTKQPKELEIEVTAMLSARMPKKLIQRLRVRAATEDRHIQDIVADLISDYLGDE